MLKECPEEVEIVPVVGNWVAAAYDDKWYVGKVLAVNLADNDAHISFMQDSTKQPAFIKRPTPADKLWIQFKSVLAVIEPPIPCGKSQRQYKLIGDTVYMIESLFTCHQANTA